MMTVPRHHLKTVVSKHDWGWWCFGFWQYRETQKIYVHTWLTGSVIAQDKPWNFEDTPSRQSQQNSDWLAVIGDKSLSYCQTCALVTQRKEERRRTPATHHLSIYKPLQSGYSLFTFVFMLNAWPSSSCLEKLFNTVWTADWRNGKAECCWSALNSSQGSIALKQHHS